MSIKIKSITDVITNSSDETYIFKSLKNPIEVVEELRGFIKSEGLLGSGMGGIIEALSTTDGSGNYSYPETYEGFPEGYLVVDIDRGYLPVAYNFLVGLIGNPLSEDESEKLWGPVESKKYREYSRLLLDPELKPEQAYQIWTEWNSLREYTGSIDKGYKDSLLKVKKYLEDRKKETTNGSKGMKLKMETLLFDKIIKLVDKNIEYED